MKKKLIIIAVILLAVIGGYIYFRSKGSSQTPTYQTDTASRGTLISTVSASGNITAGNNINIATNASGTINQVFVKVGDKVTQGQKIATISLDQNALQKQAQAMASLLSAKNQLASAQANLNQLQAAEFSANQKFLNDASMRGLATDDPTYIQEWATWKQAEANYINQAGQIQSAQASLTSAGYAYQQISSTVTSPASGTISNLTIAPGSSVSGETSSGNSNSSTPQVIGTVAREQQTIAEVDLSEIDAAKVTPGKKVTLTMDAFPNKTFTGVVQVIDTNGVVSSGVTTYPATILFDNGAPTMYPNMAVTAKIIINVVDDVIMVPSSAVQTSSSGTTTVRELQKGKLVNVPVTIGDANEASTIIVSGVNEGDTVVTAVINSTTSTGTSGASSPFSGLNRTGGAAGAGAGGGANRSFVRIGG